MNPVFSEYGLKDLLPLKLEYPDEGCTRPDKSLFCFEAGEIRVNEQVNFLIIFQSFSLHPFIQFFLQIVLEQAKFAFE